jgi:hypothetical protein
MCEQMLAQPGRKLSVLVDVSCDTTNPHNPLPFCNVSTTFDKPTFDVVAGEKVLSCVTIDHLPTLLPLESSQHFARDLLPTIMLLKIVRPPPPQTSPVSVFTSLPAIGAKRGSGNQLNLYLIRTQGRRSTCVGACPQAVRRQVGRSCCTIGVDTLKWIGIVNIEAAWYIVLYLY